MGCGKKGNEKVIKSEKKNNTEIEQKVVKKKKK